MLRLVERQLRRTAPVPPPGWAGLTAQELEAARRRGWWVTGLEPVAGDRLRLTITELGGRQHVTILEPGQLEVSTVEQLAVAMLERRRKRPGEQLAGADPSTRGSRHREHS